MDFQNLLDLEEARVSELNNDNFYSLPLSNSQ